MIRTYRQLRSYTTIEERYEYLRLRGEVAARTFGSERWINQNFYRSREWKSVREQVIIRDNGCDLGVEGFDLHDKILIHHMNPMTVEHIATGDDDILNPEFLISVSHMTHNAIHYGAANLLPKQLVERTPGDTRLW